MNLKSKRIIPLIIFLVCCALLISQHFSTSARRATFESNRTRYMSDVLRITEGVSPVLWISPEYSYISTAKYFDLSGNANHCTQSTEANKPTVAPPGLSFDGYNDYVDCGNGASLNITGNITIEAWIKPNSVSGYKCILEKQDNYWFGSSGTEIWALIGGAEMTASGAGLTIGSWQHIAFAFIPSTANTGIKFYKNGQFISQATSGSIATSTYSLLIGNDHWNEPFNGTIDEVHIYNTALSANQIQALYLAGLPKHRQ